MSAPASAHGPVVVRLRGRYEDLGPALRRIADVVLADPDAAGRLPIGSLATAAGSSEATVVRLAHELGYAGYREFRQRLSEESAAAREREGASEHVGDIDPADDLTAVIGKIAAAEVRAVQDTAAAIDLDVLAHVASAIHAARRIALVGVGASGLAAADLQQKLARVGIMATLHTDRHDALPTATLLTGEDVVIGVSHTGRTADIVDALRLARAGGARTVAITNAPGSTLAREADHVLVTAAQESPLRSGATASRIAQLTLVDCVFLAVARELPDFGAAALDRTRASLQDRRLPG